MKVCGDGDNEGAGVSPVSAEPTIHVPLCTVEGCPWPSDPDIHVPWCGHGLAYEHHHWPKRSHHHWPKRSQGGTEIAAILCPRCHGRTDTDLGDCIKEYPDHSRHYLLWQVKDKKVLVDRVIGNSLSDHPPGITETPIVMRIVGEEKVDIGAVFLAENSPAVAQDWPVTVEPHGHLKGKALPAPDDDELEWVVGDAVVRYERRALVIEGPLSWERYEELCATLETMEEAVGFWIGDLIIRGEQEFGERCYQPWTAKGYKAERLRQYAWVAQQVPAVTRLTLSWTHHRAVAALPAGEQVEWLAKAEAEGMSSRQLRECVAVQREPGGCQHTWKCEICGATK